METVCGLYGGPRGSYLRSWDAFRWATLEQHLLFQGHFLSKRLLVKRLPQVCEEEAEAQRVSFTCSASS